MSYCGDVVKAIKQQRPLSLLSFRIMPAVGNRRGGGILKIEAWENEKGEIVKYSMAYINHLIFSGDNGRVIGYDNAHNFHHKHYKGEISGVSDFTNYQELVERFEKEIKEFIE